MVCLRESLPEVREQIQNLADKLGVDYGTAKIILLENNGYDLDKAPSGAESKLYLTLLEHYNGDEKKALIAKAKTYLQPFFDWFGDWTDPEATNVSKVVDENGEPLVVWHGTRTFDSLSKEGFSKKMSGKGNRGANNQQFYFTSSKENAEYTGVGEHNIKQFIDIISSVYDLFNTDDLPSLKQLNNTISEKEKLLHELKDQIRYIKEDSILKRIINKIAKFFNKGFKSSEDLKNEHLKLIDELNGELNSLYQKSKVLYNYTLGVNYLKGDHTKTSVNTLNFIELNVDSVSPFRQSAANKVINVLYGTDGLTYSPLVLPLYLNIKNPLISDFQMNPTDENPLFLPKFSEKLDEYNQKESRLLQELLNSQYDGSISKNKFDVLFGDVFITKEPNQIKSIDNQGAFSTESSNIYETSGLFFEDGAVQHNEFADSLSKNNTDSITILEKIKNNDSYYSVLIDKLKPHLLKQGGVPIKFSDELKYDKDGKQIGGEYNDSGEIVIYRNSDLYLSSPEYVLFHEIIHLLTTKELDRNKAFYDSVQLYINYLKTQTGYDYYGFKNPYEFVSEFFTNKDFQEFLKRVPAMNTNEFVNLFKQIIHRILDFIGLNSENAYYQILPLMEDLISQQTVNFPNLFSIFSSKINGKTFNSAANQQYSNHSRQAQQELQRQIDDFKTRGYRLDQQSTVEKELSEIRKKMLSGMKSILKVVDLIGADKSDEFKANLKYQITNLQDNTISDIENIIYFIKTLSQDLVPVALEILNAVKSNNVLTDERIHSLDRNYFGFYNPLIKDIKDIYTQLEPFSEIIDKDTYRAIGDLLNSCNNILEFSRYNLRRMQVENYKLILAEKSIDANSEYVEEMVDYLKGDVMSTDKDIWSITRLFMSPDKVNDKALKTLYQIVQEAENNKANRVFKKAMKLNEIAKDISYFDDFYEKDDNGKTTGYLVRDKQYGKFHKEYRDFLNRLKIQFGMQPNDDTMSEDAEIRKEFAKAKNEWLSHRVERKYTREFYELFDGLSTEAQYAREQIEIKIRTILDKYKDTNGFTDKSRISKEDQDKLNELRIEKRLLSSIYNPDGTEKTGIERKIADELSLLESKLAEGYVTVKDVKKFNKIVEEKRKSLSKDEFDAWYEANTRVQYSEEFREELRKIDKQRFGARYAELSEQRNQLLSPYRNPQTNEPMVDLMPMVTKRAINRLEIEMMNERKKSKDKKVDVSGLYSVVPTSEYQRKRKEAERKAEEAATVNNVVDPILFEQMMESMFYLQTSHRTMKGWEPNSYYTKIVPVNPEHLEIVPNDNFNMLSPDSKFYNKNYDYDSNEFYQPKSFATEDFTDDNGKKIKKGQRLYDNSVAYKRIQSNPKNKALYDAILSLMEEANNYYSNRTFANKYKLPQIDGSTLRYMKGKGIFAGLWSKIASYFGRRVDDVGIKEEASTAPDGQKLSMIPLYFTLDLDDPSVISADLIGIVMEYYQSAVNFDEKNKIKAKAETIKSILSRRTYKKTSFGKQENVLGIKTQIYQMADLFMDMHIYGMQSKAIKWKLFNREVDVTKTVKLLGSFATAVNLMLNYAVAATGMFTSGYQMLVQSVVGRYWDGHDTLNAMKFFVTDMFWTGIRNIGNRHYKSKQWALMDLFGIGSELNTLWKNSNHNGFVSALARRLGWWGMTISDYCTKGLILDAILYNFKYVNGEFISKEDYFDKYGRTDKTKSKWRTYKSAMDSIEFKNGKVRTIDSSMQSAWEKAMPVIGDTARSLAYASDGQLTPLQKAQFTMNAFGGLVMMHRQYLPVVLSERFTLDYQYDPNLRRFREAIMQTIWRFISSIYSDRKELGLLKSVSSNWGKFKNDKVAKYNLKQASFEAAMLLYVLPQMTAFMLREAEEDDESWWKKFFAYVMMRVQFESGSPYNPMDLYNTIKTPTPAYGPFDNLNNLFSLSYETVRKIIAGEDLSEDEIKKGAYKGKSQLFKTIMKVTPLKNPYEQIMGIEDKIRYYESQIMKEEFEELD